MYCTVTPSYYIDYFRAIAKLWEEGQLNKDTNGDAMNRFATIVLPAEVQLDSMHGKPN